MRNECNIVKDLLPLYRENMVSEDSEEFVRQHLQRCAGCRQEYEDIQTALFSCAEEEAETLRKIQRKIKRKRGHAITLTVCFMLALAVAVFSVLDAPRFLPYMEGLVKAEVGADQKIRITLNEPAADFSLVVYRSPEGIYWEIEAWETLWNRWFSSERPRQQPMTVTMMESEVPDAVMYVQNNGEENVCIYGRLPQDTGVQTLPRLTLGYYLMIMAAAFTLTGGLRVFLRKREKARKWLERGMLYPIAYIISHIWIAGWTTRSYALQRDFSLILLSSILLYAAFLALHSILWEKRESRKLGKM